MCLELSCSQEPSLRARVATESPMLAMVKRPLNIMPRRHVEPSVLPSWRQHARKSSSSCLNTTNKLKKQMVRACYNCDALPWAAARPHTAIKVVIRERNEGLRPFRIYTWQIIGVTDSHFADLRQVNNTCIAKAKSK